MQRLKTLKISAEMFLSMLSEGEQHYRVIGDAIPSDAEIKFIGHFADRTILIVLSHPSFDPVEPFFLKDIPRIEPILERIDPC